MQRVSGIEIATLEEHKLELAAELLRSGGSIRVRAFGTSMLPTIWPGDILQIESKACDESALGDVILVKRERSILIHRLVNKDGKQWITRGDAMPQNDPPVAPADVLGRVSRIRRRNWVLQASGRIQPLERALAWLICHSQTCRKIALLIHSVQMDRSSRQIDEIPFAHGSPQTH